MQKDLQNFYTCQKGLFTQQAAFFNTRSALIQEIQFRSPIRKKKALQDES